MNSLPTSKKNYHQSRLSHFMCNSCANKVETMKVMDTFSPYFGHNGRNRRYNTMWTRSPLDGVQEVGGSNPLAPTGIDSRKRVHFLCASVPVKIGELDAEFVQGLFVVYSGETSATWNPDAPDLRLRWIWDGIWYEMTKFGNMVSIEYLDQVGMIALAESLKYTPYRKI